MTTLTDLPFELILHIADQLDIPSTVNLAKTNKYCYSIIDHLNNRKLYEYIRSKYDTLKRHYMTSELDIDKLGPYNPTVDYHDLLKYVSHQANYNRSSMMKTLGYLFMKNNCSHKARSDKLRFVISSARYSFNVYNYLHTTDAFANVTKPITYSDEVACKIFDAKLAKTNISLSELYSTIENTYEISLIREIKGDALYHVLVNNYASLTDILTLIQQQIIKPNGFHFYINLKTCQLLIERQEPIELYCEHVDMDTLTWLLCEHKLDPYVAINTYTEKGYWAYILTCLKYVDVHTVDVTNILFTYLKTFKWHAYVMFNGQAELIDMIDAYVKAGANVHAIVDDKNILMYIKYPKVIKHVVDAYHVNLSYVSPTGYNIVDHMCLLRLC